MGFKFKLNMLILDENVLVIVLIRRQAPFDILIPMHTYADRSSIR